jgi:branched-chain amino acid aminotransferase
MSVLPFDDRDGVIWFDGKLVPWRDARIHVLTHGLHYASCVFEGERAYGGHVFKLTEHSQRLVNSADLLGFKLPYGAAEIDAATREVIAANNLVDCYVRPLAWRGSEMMGVSAQKNTIHVAIATWEWPAYFSPELREKGIRMAMSRWRRPAPDTAPTASKAAGLYMICTLSKHQAEQDGCADALMLDYRGQVAEATGANVFLGMKGELHTPKPDCFLDGITRRTVIELATRRGIKVIERAVMPDELAKAEEVFICGTAAEVTPVGEIGPHKYKVGPITRQMMEDYSTEVRRFPNAKTAAA